MTARTPADGSRVLLVTGGGSGIGAAVARRADEDGWTVVVTGRRPGPLDEVAAACTRVLPIPADGLDVRTVAVELLLCRVLPAVAAVHVLDAGLVPMRQHLAHADPGFDFPWPDIVAVRPEGAFSLLGGLDWSRGPWAAIVVDSGHSPVDLVRRVEGLRAWWPIVAVITARPQVAASHPVFDTVTMIPAPAAIRGVSGSARDRKP